MRSDCMEAAGDCLLEMGRRQRCAGKGGQGDIASGEEGATRDGELSEVLCCLGGPGPRLSAGVKSHREAELLKSKSPSALRARKSRRAEAICPPAHPPRLLSVPPRLASPRTGQTGSACILPLSFSRHCGRSQGAPLTQGQSS